MSRHLDNLQRLLVKLQARYGDDDDSVHELRVQLKALEELESRNKKLRTENREARGDRGAAAGVARLL